MQLSGGGTTPAAGTPTEPAAGSPVAAPAPSSAPAVSPRALQGRVAPAVVALVVSGKGSAPRIATGVFVTASGLVVTSRAAITEAIAGSATVALVRASARGRLSGRDLAAALPARLVAVSDDLDLALLEASADETIFYPHLPIVRRAPGAAEGGGGALAVGHSARRGLWSAAVVSLGAPVASTGPRRWMRPLQAGADGAIEPGTPLVDAVGRIVALAVDAPPGPTGMVVDAEGLLRFLLAANSADRRFAGVPLSRRPLPALADDRSAGDGLGRDRRAGRRSSEPSSADVPAAGASPFTDTAEATLPGIVRKGLLDRRFQGADAVASGRGGAGDRLPPATSAAGSAIRAAERGQMGLSFVGATGSIQLLPASRLERQAVPRAVSIDTGDAPARGPGHPPVTIVEMGDYHAPETRDAEPVLRALIDGPDAPARLLWRDADPGYGPDYHLPARMARAAAEQDAFWEMHDRLMQAGAQGAIDLNRARSLARELELDPREFEGSLNSEGLSNAVETDVLRAGRLPLLCTPSFLVNGQAVDGGSIAGAALRAAVEDELFRLARAGSSPAGAAAPAPALVRAIAPGTPAPGVRYDLQRLARTATAASIRRAASARAQSLTAPVATTQDR